MKTDSRWPDRKNRCASPPCFRCRAPRRCAHLGLCFLAAHARAAAAYQGARAASRMAFCQHCAPAFSGCTRGRSTAHWLNSIAASPLRISLFCCMQRIGCLRVCSCRVVWRAGVNGERRDGKSCGKRSGVSCDLFYEGCGFISHSWLFKFRRGILPEEGSGIWTWIVGKA